MEQHLHEETSLAELISEEDFLPLLQATLRDLGFIASCHYFLEAEIQDVNKRVLGHLNEEAQLLESFLDDYDARNNKTFSNFTEIVASIRNLIDVSYIQRHILRRYFKYHLDDDVAQVAEFHLKSGESYEFLVQSVKDLVKDFLAEATDVLGLDCSKRNVAWANKMTDPALKSHLPHNVDDEVISNAEASIAQIANGYLQSAKVLGTITLSETESPRELRDFVTKTIPEERCRQLEAMVHGLQSKYDTYLKNTQTEQSNPMLPKLRGHISMALHLLEFTTGLVHFYERHENDIRSVEAKRRISRLVDKNEIVSLIVKYGMHFAQRYIERGQAYAEAMLQEYSKINSLELTLPDGVYLHARPVSLIVGVVQHHGAPVQMEIEDEKVEANSIIQVLMVSGSYPKANAVTFYGDEAPLADLKRLFDAKLGEEGLEDLPPELDYLR